MFMMNKVLAIRGVVPDVVSVLIRQRQLLLAMASRELTDRYTGQMFGLFWAIAHPLVMVAVYVFVFAYVFKVSMSGMSSVPFDYSVYLLSGLVPWITAQEAIMKSTTAIRSSSSLVKQVVFPLEVVPVKGVLGALFTQLVFLIVLAVYTICQSGKLPFTYVLLPLLLPIQILGLAGLSFLLCSIGAFFRDLKDFMQVFCVTGIYLMPVCYMPEMVPEVIRPLLYLNPFSYMTWCFQDVCYFGTIAHPWAWVMMTVMSLLVFYFGARVFRFLKPMFGNVI
jgi:lipopolysaccharide transport system permease protein